MPAPSDVPRLLVLFPNDQEREASCFAGGDRAWLDRTDEGPARYEAYAIDQESPRPGPAVAAGLLVVPRLLGPAMTGRTSDLLEGLRANGTAIDLIAAGSPMEAIAWTSRHLPRLADCLRADGEVRPELPSFWRRWAEFRLSLARRQPDPTPRPRSATDQDGSGTFSIEVIKRFLSGGR